MNHTYKQEFISNFYSAELKHYLNKTNQCIYCQREEIYSVLNEALETLFSKIIKFQSVIEIPIKYIHISFMLTSVYKNEPKFRIDAYDENGIFGESLLSEEASAESLFIYREEFRQIIEAEIKQRHLERCFRAEAIHQFVNASLMPLTYLYVYNLKYNFAHVDQIKGYNEIVKAKDFYLAAGSYKDWQKLLYADLEDVDIFFNREKKSLKYRNYNQKVYHKKSFQSLELQNSKFIECDFRECEFAGTDLSDCVFEKCIFRNVSFVNTICFGILYEKCTFQEVVFDNCNCDGSKCEEVYRMAEIAGSKISKLEFIKCNLRNYQLENCKVEKLKVDNESIALDSILEEYKEMEHAILSCNTK